MVSGVSINCGKNIGESGLNHLNVESTYIDFKANLKPSRLSYSNSKVKPNPCRVQSPNPLIFQITKKYFLQMLQFLSKAEFNKLQQNILEDALLFPSSYSKYLPAKIINLI